MISVCVPFYPWYREHDRSDEVLSVLVKGLNNCDGAEELELCLVDAGVMDVWGSGRVHYSSKFERDIRSEFKGTLNYLLDEGSIHNDRGTKRFWTAMSMDRAVRMATRDRILIFGIDCYAPKDLIKRHIENVDYGKAWVISAFSIPAFTEFDYKGEYSRWHPAKGIVGMMKGDFLKIGGYDTNYIKDRCDSIFYVNINKNLKVKVVNEEGFYHINHPGSNVGKIWRIPDAQGSEGLST